MMLRKNEDGEDAVACVSGGCDGNSVVALAWSAENIPAGPLVGEMTMLISPTRKKLRLRSSQLKY